MPLRLTIILLALFVLTACEKESPALVPDMDLSFELIDESGQTVTDADFAGRLRLVFFGFTSCPDICPITLSNIGNALYSMGADANGITVLFISIDPQRDTPERLATYTNAFHPSVIGLTGSLEQLDHVTSGFRTTYGFTLRDGSGQDRPMTHVEYESMPEPVDYLPFHSSQVYVISAGDELVDIIGYGSMPEKIEQTLRSHLR